MLNSLLENDAGRKWFLTPLPANRGILVACVCLGCFILGIAAIGWPVSTNGGFPLDDSWIHQVVGRNVARFGIPGFNPGTASSGSSSTIWPWIIALNYGLFPSVSPVGFLFALNAIFLFAVCRVLFH
jgi:hypothetical protein